MASFPVENAFGVPETLATARLRLPADKQTYNLRSAKGRASPSLVPTAKELDGIFWVAADSVLWTWSGSLLAELASVMAATDTKLAFVEPTAGLGLRHRLQVGAGPWLARSTGHRHHRDIPVELRHAGLVVTTTVRFRDGIGHYVWGEARCYSHRITTR